MQHAPFFFALCTRKPVELILLDIKKCFDSLSLKYTINDLFDEKLTNDKLELLFKQNKFVKVKTLTLYEDTDVFDLNNVVMQGTIFAGLKCTTQLDKLGRKAYHEEEPLYVYKNTVCVPPLEMVAIW